MSINLKTLGGESSFKLRNLQTMAKARCADACWSPG